MAFQKLAADSCSQEKEHDVEEQNDIVKAKNDVPKYRMHDAKPSEFETDDQFCPGMCVRA